MGLLATETRSTAPAFEAGPPTASAAATSARPRTGRAVVLLAAGLAAWAAAYAAIQPLSAWLGVRVLGLAPASHLGQSVAFFLYDAPKVLLLLTLIVFLVGIVRSFFTAERTRAILAGKRESVGNVLAELGLAVPVEKAEDPREIARLRVLTTPALVVDGTVRASGKVLAPEAVKDLLRG
jgi:hypothetical protein